MTLVGRRKMARDLVDASRASDDTATAAFAAAEEEEDFVSVGEASVAEAVVEAVAAATAAADAAADAPPSTPPRLGSVTNAATAQAMSNPGAATTTNGSRHPKPGPHTSPPLFTST